jgi:DnaJ-class molecular chaperone
MRDPYTVLGVDRKSSAKDIKAAFRKLAKKWHPDQNTNDPKAQAKFAEISQAYEIVGDDDKRKAFDRGEIGPDGKPKFAGFEGAGPFGRGGAAGDPFAGFSDLFGRGGQPGSFEFRTARGPAGGQAFGADDLLREMFGGNFQQAGAQPRGAARPADLQATTTVALEDVVAGARINVRFPDGRALAVKLPDYLEDGQTIRLKGQGEAGPGNQRGDALVTMKFARHPRFRVEGRNLAADLDVALKDAVLGAKLPFDTLDGRIALTLPPWSGGDRQLRVKGKGLPLKGGGRGDLTVQVRIVLDSVRDADLAEWLKRHQK